MDRTRYARPSWIDNTAFLYSRLPAPPPGGTQRLTGGRVFLHRLGTDVADRYPGLRPRAMSRAASMPVDFFFRGVGSPDSSIAVGEYDAGLGNSPKAVFRTTRPSSPITPAGSRSPASTMTSAASCCTAPCFICAARVTRRVSASSASPPTPPIWRRPRLCCPKAAARSRRWPRDPTRSTFRSTRRDRQAGAHPLGRRAGDRSRRRSRAPSWA